MYEVTGYDRQTGRLTVSYSVPKRKIALVKQIAKIRTPDDGFGSYPLGTDQISKIAASLDVEIDQGKCDFYLEPYEELARDRVGSCQSGTTPV